jgi:hypothetical protein
MMRGSVVVFVYIVRHICTHSKGLFLRQPNGWQKSASVATALDRASPVVGSLVSFRAEGRIMDSQAKVGGLGGVISARWDTPCRFGGVNPLPGIPNTRCRATS